MSCIVATLLDNRFHLKSGFGEFEILPLLYDEVGSNDGACSKQEISGRMFRAQSSVIYASNLVKHWLRCWSVSAAGSSIVRAVEQSTGTGTDVGGGRSRT